MRESTWCGMCTLMSWVRKSTHRGKTQCTVPPSWASQAFHSLGDLKGMWGAVWCTRVNALIQKWYPSHGISQNFAQPVTPPV